MKPLPPLDNEAAMAAWGRRSALLSARKDACEALRDACVLCQSAEIHELPTYTARAIAAAQRLADVSALWADMEQSRQQALPLEAA